jgi:hypothetical protein
MALSKKHQTVGQRYQIGDRVYRKSVTLGSGNGQKYRTRYGTIESVTTTPNSKGALNYYYMVEWEGSNSGSPSKHIQHRLIKAEPIPTDVQNTLAEQAYEEERIEAAFKDGGLPDNPIQLFEDIE